MSDDYLDDMMNQAPGAINFTMFLTLFGERLQGTDPEDVIRNAFGCFDETMVGKFFSFPLLIISEYSTKRERREMMMRCFVVLNRPRNVIGT